MTTTIGRRQFISALGSVISLVLLAVWVFLSSALAQDDKELLKRGRQLVTKNCSRCHAIGRTGTSPHPGAPAFRTLASRYQIESLVEGLVEGFSSGHPDMPDFVFQTDEAAAIMAYLKSIQER
jgi:mono/diheme cytochrome c family protein